MTIVGSFINALFNFLLGWIRGTAQWLWNMVTSDSHGGLLGWAMRNWLPLVILLCIFGVVMDFLVYLIRWQPYRVWGNFWTRFLPKRARRTPTGRHLIYADGTMIEEEQVVQHTHKPKPAPKREGTAATRRKRVIPARRAHFGTTQTELTPPPLTIAQDKINIMTIYRGDRHDRASTGVFIPNGGTAERRNGRLFAYI